MTPCSAPWSFTLGHAWFLWPPKEWNCDEFFPQTNPREQVHTMKGFFEKYIRNPKAIK